MGRLDQLQRRLGDLEKTRPASVVNCIILTIKDCPGSGLSLKPTGLRTLDNVGCWMLRKGESMAALTDRVLAEVPKRPVLLVETHEQ